MGIWSAIVDETAGATVKLMTPLMLSKIAVISNETVVLHHVANGGCAKDFATAMRECHPSPPKEFIKERGDATNRVVDANACVKATAALRKCFASNPAMFKH
jgi:hypothetical protein